MIYHVVCKGCIAGRVFYGCGTATPGVECAECRTTIPEGTRLHIVEQERAPQPGRTEAEMREILSRVLSAWQKRPELSLGKLICYAANGHAMGGAIGIPGLTDMGLAGALEEYTR